MQVSATFVFVTRVNCVHCLISPDIHLSVFNGTETIRSDKRSIDISNTPYLLYFVKKVSEHLYGIRVSETVFIRFRKWSKDRSPDNFSFFVDGGILHMEIRGICL